MRRVVITGGPGAGKTMLLHELAGLGFSTVSESAREAIAERIAQGLPPRPAPEAWASEILRRDAAKYAASKDLAKRPAASTLVFFDRCAIEALGMLNEAAPLPEAVLEKALRRYRFHRTVFVLPPWAEIYRTDPRSGS